MNPNIFYTVMVICLLSVLGYTVYSSDALNGIIPHKAISKAFGIDDSKPAASVKKHVTSPALSSLATPTHATSTQTTSTRETPTESEATATLFYGASPNNVIDILGLPDSIDAHNGRWVYDSYVVQFRDNKVIGYLKTAPDKPSQLARTDIMCEGHIGPMPEASTNQHTRQPIQTANSSSPSNPLRGTSRSSYSGFRSGYGSGSIGYRSNYYMSRVGPQYRQYHRQRMRTIPRGMSQTKPGRSRKQHRENR